jgi:N-acetylneuraminate synthase
MSDIAVGDKTIGSGSPPYIVAELCANHNGSLERALAIIDAAKAAGADAVKLQTYTPDTMTLDTRQPGFVLQGGLWNGYSLYELYQKAHTPWDWHEALFARGREIGITIFSTPFDETAVDFLERFDPPFYKIASFELIDTPLIEKAASTGKPLIISTGNASEAEIDAALAAALANGAPNVVLLHCISSYPAPAEDSNLRLIPRMAERFSCLIGLSDHTLGTAVSVTAIGLGAVMIEKHFTIDKSAGGLDDSFSIEPNELSALVKDTRTAWSALGGDAFRRTPAEAALKPFRRSVYAVADIAKGERFSRANIRSIRPGHGLPPNELCRLIGRQAKANIACGTPMSWDLVS